MSQCARVLEVLRDRRPHTITEIHDRAGTMRLNSRISDLRKQGHDIRYWRDGEHHVYQLIRAPVERASIPEPCADRSGQGAGSGAGRVEREPAQLSISEVAA